MEAGQRIGRYLLTKKIGKGGMAEIFKAEEQVSGGHQRVVAIKRLFPKLSADREFVGMFVNEARIASSMFHPNIVQTYDLINYGSYYYIVMEYLEGLDLEEFVLVKGPGGLVLPLDEAAYVVHEVAMGLSYAHKGGARPTDGEVVHRDISPGNILIDVDGLVKVTDFGIARAMQYASFTKPGVLKGKYEYMAPEYVKGKNFDGRADLFSLGVVLYELLTGENPFAAVMPKEIWEKIVKYDPPKPSKTSPKVPKALDAVVSRALSKDPEKRYRTGEEMAAVLVSFFSDVGRDRVAGALGARVSRLMEKGEVTATSPSDIQAFLPPDSTIGEHTQEIHLDTLLDLVDPIQVPRPAIHRKPVTEPTTAPVKKKTQKKRRPSWKRKLVVIAFLLALVAGGLGYFFWPRPVGYLTVTSSRRAEVFIDGQRIGLTPLLKKTLPVGAHLVEVRRPGRTQAKTQQPNIKEGELTTIEVTWKKPHVRKPGKKRIKKKKKKKKKTVKKPKKPVKKPVKRPTKKTVKKSGRKRKK
ncbi:protein kinase [Myxococcota bacterium]